MCGDRGGGGGRGGKGISKGRKRYCILVGGGSMYW